MRLFQSLLLFSLLHYAHCALVKPPPLLFNDTIRIIATGGAVTASSLASGVSFFQTTYHLRVLQDPHVLDVDMYYAGTDTIRASSVLSALSEPGTSALWAARGGYGTARIISLVQNAAIRKWLIGYSDVTALHALWNKEGFLSLHGPMGSDITSFSSTARQLTIDILSHTVSSASYPGSIRYGTSSVSGVFLGGNLSVLSSLVGSGFLPSYAGAILFIEDTGEAAYSWDRMLTQLLRSEELAGIVGIAIGQMVGADTTGYTALELLDRTLAPLGIPVITGIQVGHSTATALPLVLGSDATIDVANGRLLTKF
ncbi:hypothetical protein MKEN_01093900 [Mycena kentingensis (nom. inval.)]|nr:hypothetical protein MKEN_01093900 [Mycena kentingensis (nom. inval.)]